MSDKERLETIKEFVKKIESVLYDEWRQQELTILIESLYYADHVDWLINRVEELEEGEGLYKEATQSYSRVLDGFIDDNERLQKQNKRLREAIIEAIADIEEISPHEAKKTLREALKNIYELAEYDEYDLR